MTKMTSAYANKVIRGLEEDKDFWLEKEENSSTYVAILEETPVIPEYDYSEVAQKIAEIDDKIVKIKHALNLSNCTAKVTVEDEEMTIDMLLVKMAQLNKRKEILDKMRKRLPKARVEQIWNTRNSVPEYQYINYDLELIKAEYEQVSNIIMQMQMALDFHNQTVQFEVEI